MAQSYKYFIIIPFFIFLFGLQQVKCQGVEITEKLNEYIPPGISLYNESGDTVDFKEQIKIPTIVTFVYYNCPGVCTPLMSETSSIIEKSDLILGKDYQFFTISFNPTDDTQLAINKKKNYLNTMAKKEQAKTGWKFFTADSLNIAKATESLGFQFKQVGNEFIHKAAMIIVSSEGMISRYNLGVNMLPLELKISITEAEKGNSLPKTYKNDEYCYPYVVPAFQRLNSVAQQAGYIIIVFAVGLFITLVLPPILKKR